METITVKRDNNAHPSYSGCAGLWAKLTLYRTKGGKRQLMPFNFNSK